MTQYLRILTQHVLWSQKPKILGTWILLEIYKLFVRGPEVKAGLRASLIDTDLLDAPIAAEDLCQDLRQGHLDRNPKALYSCVVYTWAWKGVLYHDFGVYLDTLKLHGAFEGEDFF